MTIDQVSFPAIIKQVSIRKTASEDREARLVLEFRPDDDIMPGLVRFSQLEAEMMVAIVPINKQEKTDTDNEKATGRKKSRPR